jgi:mRNA-degrading endonuclease HigB of HigAB toxin-antitoxin module
MKLKLYLILAMLLPVLMLAYPEQYHQKNDSLVFAERNARNQYYKIQLETKEITQEKNKAVHQKWLIMSISGAVLLIFILLLITSLLKSK